MKKGIVLGLACSIVTVGALHAQTGSITVKNGAKFTFAVNAVSNISESVQGQDMTIDSKTDGTIDLAAKKVSPKQIDWTYGLTKAHLNVTGSMLPNSVDSTIKGKPSNFSTDLNGHITAMPKLGNELQILSMGGFQKTSLSQMFSPLMTRSLKAGDSWEETSSDTIDNPAMAGITMMAKRTTKYTFDGVVDTLHMKLARVRTEVTSLALEGSGEMQGMKMAIDGDGTTTTTSYYATDNGILHTALTDGEINARISITGGMEMVIPMAIKLNSTMVRK
jgi:hypothetical protein